MLQVQAQVQFAAVHLRHPHHNYWLKIATAIVIYRQKQLKTERKHSKKRRSTAADREEQDDAIAATLRTVQDQGDKLTSVLTELQKSNAEQTKMMSQFMGAMLEALKISKDQ